MKKTITLIMLFSCSIHIASAQFYKKLQAPDTFSDSISIIVQDFKKNFSTIEGDQLQSRGETDVYRSKVTIPGSLHCAIYRFHSVEDTTASWQAIMYEGESYEEAIKIYKTTFRQLKNSKIKWVEKNNISFEGDLEMPGENIRFAVTPLRLNITDRPYLDFFGEIELISSYDGWEVHLNLHNKKSDADQY
ncbi:MAG: hypothetical protein ABIQ31_21500 [Ferruginibacter sp.]